MDRNEFLIKLLEIAPILKVHYVNKYVTPNDLWPKEQYLSKINDEDKQICNLRKILKTEVLLDIEAPERLAHIESKLKEKNWSYQVWFTGSRGYHISIFFAELKQYDLIVRNRIRKYIIKEFNCDESKSSEKTWMALEYSPHFKTGNLKSLVKEITTGINAFDPEFVKHIQSQSALERMNVIKAEDDFKKFVEEDPYLKYVLNNVIPDGKYTRNNVLFKNLAVGLVKAGLTREDVEAIAEKVVANCPGKIINEFMGWADKAFLGELTEYNKAEIVKWADECGLPVMYKLSSDLGIKEAMSAKDLWNIIWEMEIAEQPIWKELCFYNLLGTVLDERQQDIRANIIFISPTSTGKDLGIDLVQYVLDKMDYITVCPSEITDKTLIGGVNDEVKKFNAKYGLFDVGDENKDKRFKDPIEHGVLKTAHWLGMAEAQTVFKPGAHNQGIQRILRQAMDKKRQIEKGVGAQMIKCNTNTSFLIASYPIPNILEKLKETGLFQRVFFYYKNLTKEQSRKIRRKKNMMKYNADILKNYDREEYVIEFVKKLEKIRYFHNENKNSIKMPVDTDQYVNEKDDFMEDRYSYLEGNDFDIIQSMLRRAACVASIIYLNCIKDERMEISNRDIDIAYTLFQECLDSIKQILLVNDAQIKKLNILRFIVSERKKISSTELSKEMREKAGVKSPNEFRKFLDLLVAKNEIYEVREGRHKFIVPFMNPEIDTDEN